jgi:AcrR family transcriptional regulator
VAPTTAPDGPRPPAGSGEHVAAGSDGRELRSQGRRTRARLLDAGMEVLGAKGYHAARVDDIVEAASVSHGTFYLYFANKQELLSALAAQCAEEMTRVVGGLPAVSPDPAGRTTVRAWLGEFVATYRRYGVVIRAWMEDTVNDRELIELGRDTFGVVSASLVDRLVEAEAPNVSDPQLGAVALMALIERFTYYLASRGDPAGDAAALDTLAAMVHRGWFAGSSRAVGVGRAG